MKSLAVLILAMLATMPTARAALEPVVVSARPNTELDRTARAIVADELAQASARGDAPLVLIGEARLGAARDSLALFIQLQSARECGSAGCSTSVYVLRHKTWKRVLDAVGGAIKVDSRRHGGMRDLVVGGDGRWIWTGSAYRDTSPAANPHLRRHGA